MDETPRTAPQDTGKKNKSKVLFLSGAAVACLIARRAVSYIMKHKSTSYYFKALGILMDWNELPCNPGEPDFANLLAVLRRERPARPTLFEFFLNEPLYRRLFDSQDPSWPEELVPHLKIVHAFCRAGYDYATLGIPGFSFPAGPFEQKATRSLNEGAVIGDWDTFAAYAWPDPEKADYAILDRLAPFIPSGMKLIVSGPMGVLENAIKLVGYESLCFMIRDDPALAGQVFDHIGSRLVRYYELSARHEIVGAIIGNDDWGFKSQTLLAPEEMRRFVFPWHAQIVAAAHAAGKPAILHSCGCLEAVIDEIVEEMQYDAKHSFEDIIQPIEAAYDQYHRRIALLGGIDVDFVCRSTPEEIYARSRRMLERAEADGAYALGTGNSVPEYVPDAHYFALIRAALDQR